MRIAVLGGTGPAGRSLATRLASVGFDVVVGSRSKDRAARVRDELVAAWPDHDLAIDAAANPVAAEADLVVVATPWDAAAETALSVEEQLRGKVVVSMANALARVGREFQPLVPPRGSVAASVQVAVPRAHVAAAFHHVPARELGAIDHPIQSDVLICADHHPAVEATAEVVARIPDLRPLDAGQLSNAAPIEAFAAVLLQLNARYRTRVAIKLIGIDDDGPGLVAADLGRAR
ncbi:MAG: NADPH-dependent F420 reductase [Acidimicrobiales bacterium]